MIISNTQRDTYTEGIGETKKMNIGAGVEAHIIKVLTENSYKQPLESSIREAASNALDSHLEAGVTEPIIVKVYKDDTGMYNLQVKDVGLGLDTASFEKYIMGIGESTKRDSDVLLGGYGAGAKAPLSFVNSFTYECIKDGMERKFLIFKGALLPESSLIYERPTDAHNGVTVTIPIGNSYEDLQNTRIAIKQQLAYFTGIYFDVPGLNNDFKVVRNEDWQISSFNNFDEMHLCLKDVYYPIEWKKLGISRITLPIGLRFDVYDGIQPVFNREELIYTEETKKVILDKIKKVSTSFVEKYNESVKEFDDFLEAYDSIGNNDKYINIEGNVYLINSVLATSDIPANEPKVKGITLQAPKWYKENRHKLLTEYLTIAEYDYSATWRTKNLYTNMFDQILNHNSVVLLNSTPIGNFKEYLKDIYSRKTYFVVEGTPRALGSVKHNFRNNSYREILKLNNHPKDKWRDLIKEFQYVRDTVAKKIEDGRNLETSQGYTDWLEEKAEERKANRVAGIGNYKALNKQVGDITIAYAETSSKAGVVFKKDVYKIENLHKNKFITVYFLEEEKERAKKLYKALKNVNTKVAIIGPRELKKVPTEMRWNRITRSKEEKTIHNFKTIDQFMKRDVKPFTRLVTSFKVKEVLNTWNSISSGEDIFKKVVSKHIADVDKLKLYLRNYYESLDGPIVDAMLQIAEDQNLFDLEIMEIVNRVKKDTDLFDFVVALETPHSWDSNSQKLYKKVFYSMILFKKKHYGLFEEFDIVPVPPVETLLAMHESEEPFDDEDLDEDLDDDGEGALVDEDFEIDEVTA